MANNEAQAALQPSIFRASTEYPAAGRRQRLHRRIEPLPCRTTIAHPDQGSQAKSHSTNKKRPIRCNFFA
jgi:hypothetical protein